MVPHIEPELEVPGALAQVDLPASQVQAVLHVLVPDGRQVSHSVSVIHIDMTGQVTEDDKQAVNQCGNHCLLALCPQTWLHIKLGHSCPQA